MSTQKPKTGDLSVICQYSIIESRDDDNISVTLSNIDFDIFISEISDVFSERQIKILIRKLMKK